MTRWLSDLCTLTRGFPCGPFRHQLYRLYRVYVSRRSNRVVNAEIDGVRYRLDLSETIDSEIYFRGAYEPAATMAVKRIVRPGMTVFDVGANIGYFSLLFAQLVGDSGSVIAFEPTTWAFEKLSANIALNAFRNVSAERLALSDVAQSREARSEQMAFRASWPVSGPVARRDPEVVTFVPLDSYVAQLDIKHVNLIKINIGASPSCRSPPRGARDAPPMEASIAPRDREGNDEGGRRYTGRTRRRPRQAWLHLSDGGRSSRLSQRRRDVAMATQRGRERLGHPWD